MLVTLLGYVTSLQSAYVKFGDNSFCINSTETNKTSVNYKNTNDINVNLNWINVVSNDDKLCLLFLNQTRHGIHARPHDGRTFRRSIHLTLHTFLRTAPQSCRLLLACLRPIFIHQTKQLRGYKITCTGEPYDMHCTLGLYYPGNSGQELPTTRK